MRRPLTVLMFAGALLVGGCGHSGTPPPGAPAGVQSARTPDATAATAEFWTWFAQNVAATGAGSVDPKPVGERLQRIHRGLGCEIGGSAGARTLVITANGDVMIFNLVKEVAKQAPAMSGWSVIALRPRQALRPVKTATATVRPDDVSFTAAPENGRLAVNLFVKGLTGDNQDDLGAGALALVQQAVGEHDAFGVLTLGPIAAAPARLPTGARPLAELATAVDDFKKKATP